MKEIEIAILGLIITIIALAIGAISLYHQLKEKNSKLEFEKKVIKSMNKQNRILKKAIKEMQNNRNPSDWEKHLKEEELYLKKQRETRLQVQTAVKIIKEYFKR